MGGPLRSGHAGRRHVPPAGSSLRPPQIGYVLPAALAWTGVGLALNVWPLGDVAPGAMVAYASYYGFVEATGRQGLSPPTSGWQVPQSFVIGRSRRRRLLTWGAILGSGFAMRNPYAGFGLLPHAVAAMGDLRRGVAFAAAVGGAHAAARGTALVRDAGRLEGADYFDAILSRCTGESSTASLCS